ncbi:MAG: hypothetical protein ABI707_09835 [Ferruginibacter sp.]
MKKAILLLVCIGTTFCSFAQQMPAETSKPALTKEDYLKRSKTLWKVAIIMVSAGGAMVITGIALAANNNNYGDNETVAGVLFFGGCAVMLSSLGFSIPAHINKKKALSVSFKNEPASVLQRSAVFYKSVPSVSLKIAL